VVASRVIPANVAPLAAIALAGSVTLVAFVLVLFISGFFHAGELRVLRDIRTRALRRKGSPMPPFPEQVEMAGEIVDTGPEPPSAGLEGEFPSDAGQAVSPGSQSPRR
jgi:hypothetical protein